MLKIIPTAKSTQEFSEERKSRERHSSQDPAAVRVKDLVKVSSCDSHSSHLIKTKAKVLANFRST